MNRDFMNEQTVIHNKEQKRFEYDFSGEIAFVEYKPLESNVWSIPHTFVPPQLNGKGLASKPVKALLEFCKENHIKVIPECSFVVKYIERNPEWAVLLDE